MATLTIQEQTKVFSERKKENECIWSIETIHDIALHKNNRALNFNYLNSKYELNFDDFELFWYSKPIQTLKDNGVILCL